MKNRITEENCKCYPLSLMNDINQNLAAMVHMLSHLKVVSGSLTLHSRWRPSPTVDSFACYCVLPLYIQTISAQISTTGIWHWVIQYL